MQEGSTTNITLFDAYRSLAGLA